ncbi:hypothetical protein [Zunongwangia endophytica]|uniref:Cytochrome C and Quinol oxidase polypeptide I n=1 Tax=Zunongwangia endophytica TaxID=1808945 RepID=A0ABV8H652_9FLAO|nr:hypothetical protein [Zunongwangia endophytica]MDN3596162.1 hypothetical protein [Zunongwangia endophytica]
MKQLLAKSYKLFWIFIPLVFMYGMFNKDHLCVLNIHDTYYAIHDVDFAGLIVIFYALFGVCYWLIDFFNKKLINWMTAYHVFISIFGLLFLLIFYGIINDLEFDYALKETLMMLTFIAGAITITAQLLFPLNLILSYFREKK